MGSGRVRELHPGRSWPPAVSTPQPSGASPRVREMKDELQAEAQERVKATQFGNRDGSAPRGAPEEEKGRWSEKAADSAGIGKTTVKRVDRVAREAEDPDSPVREEAPRPVIPPSVVRFTLQTHPLVGPSADLRYPS